MIGWPKLDSTSDVPLYRQLYDHFRRQIDSGELAAGERLPATRELAGMLGLNRTTVSAAYELLESSGLISGQVGRGSFVTGSLPQAGSRLFDWTSLIGPGERPSHENAQGAISFASSKPAAELFPLEDFAQSCLEVTADRDFGSVLQLGSPAGYEPLRQYLMEQSRSEGVLGPGDDLIIISGVQQAMDLLCRVLAGPKQSIALEDPVYPGTKNLFSEAGASLTALPVGRDGVDPDRVRTVVLRDRPRAAVLTPNFQNPTGASIPADARRAIVRAACDAGTVLIENDTYGELRYHGESVPACKTLDESGGTVLLRSFSKVAFPGLRVGWVVGPRPLIARLASAKQLCDLHTDQFSQAALWRFAISGRLAAHREAVIIAGRQRLEVVLNGCAAELPVGTTYTRPEGGMNLWIRLPEPLDAAELLVEARQRGVSYLPGRFFGVAQRHSNCLRLSFAGISPRDIAAGMGILGEIFRSAAQRSSVPTPFTPAPALV